MADVLGLDIGGANTKAAYLHASKGRLQSSKVAVEYFPVWKEPEKLARVLAAIKERLGAAAIDALSVTMTAELSDAYQTKREGVRQIIASVRTAFPETSIYVLNTDAKLESAAEALQNPLGVAAANWAATGWLVAKRISDCVVVDVGSTSASIIPVSKGKIAAKGKTDLAKLICGELVYTGSLRTNVATTVQFVPMKDVVANVSSELFALSADVHLLLGNITSREYTCETADGRGKTMSEALARLARVVCADTEMLSKQEIIDLANYIYERQVNQVAESLAKVYAYVKATVAHEVPVVVTGLGRDFLARKAAEKIHASSVVDLGSLMPPETAVATPAFAVALMAVEKMEGEPISWTQ